jgi:DNA-binding MarR family transcriptional regulator
MPDTTLRTSPDEAGTDAATQDPATEELLSAVRSLFTYTRKVRSWVADAGPMTVLGVVAEHGEARVSAIAASLLMDVSTVSRSLTALCREGLVQWRTDEADLRSHLVSCTPAGLQRLADRRTLVAREFDSRLADWPKADLAYLSRLLHRFVASVLAEPVGTSTSPAFPTAKESA